MEKIDKPLEAWRDELSDAQFHVCRLGGTERAFTGEYHDSKVPGIYHCACCGEALFDSDAKYDSGSGWPRRWRITVSATASQVSRIRWSKMSHLCFEPVSVQ